MNLVIGKTSQLAQYFPEDYLKISSRDLDFNFLENNSWENVYVTFAEQRIYDPNIDYISPNYLYTLKIIESLVRKCKKIVCYTSCELWNELSGHISVEMEPRFFPLNNEYTISKLLLLNKIKELRKIDSVYNRVIFVHPFYFNSAYRSKYFLFGKIFDSILNEKKIEVNNLDFYRDMVHARFVVKKSIETNIDCMVGAGKLFNIRDFVRDLYTVNNLDYFDLVKENVGNGGGKPKLMMAKVDWEYSYSDLLRETQEDLMERKNGYFRKSD